MLALGPPVRRVAATLLLLGAVALLDWLSGEQLGFFVFYFAPVSYAALRGGRWGALATAVAAALVWSSIEHLEGAPTDLPLYWNGTIRLLAFACMGLGVAHIQRLLARERELNDELQRTLTRVHQLKGLLPICGSCKRVRNDRGYWERLERYFEAHSEVEFTHHLCPDCFERMSPDEKVAS